MQCPRCQHENSPRAKFCEECATPLIRTCSNCGTQLSPTAKFCPECASPVDAGAAQLRFASPGAYTPNVALGDGGSRRSSNPIPHSGCVASAPRTMSFLRSVPPLDKRM